MQIYKIKSSLIIDIRLEVTIARNAAEMDM